MKLRVAILAVGCAVALSLHAQTAKVIQLNDKDAQHIKALYEQKQQIESEIALFQDTVRGQYTQVKVDTPDNAMCVTFDARESHCTITSVLPGWENGIEFSEDFKFIVPKAAPKWESGGGWTFSGG